MFSLHTVWPVSLNNRSQYLTHLVAEIIYICIERVCRETLASKWCHYAQNVELNSNHQALEHTDLAGPFFDPQVK